MLNYIYAVSIDLDIPIYLTDFHRSIIHDSKIFISGEIDVQSSVTQKSQPSASDFNLTLSAVDQTLVNAFANNDYKNRRCLIERLTLDDDENVIESEIWLDGDCPSCDLPRSICLRFRLLYVAMIAHVYILISM